MVRNKGKCRQNVAVSTHTVVTQLNLTEVILTHTVHTVVLFFVPLLKRSDRALSNSILSRENSFLCVALMGLLETITLVVMWHKLCVLRTLVTA